MNRTIRTVRHVQLKISFDPEELPPPTLPEEVRKAAIREIARLLVQVVRGDTAAEVDHESHR